MAADPVPVRRLWRPAVLLAIPAVAVLAVLAALHVLDAGYAFVAALAAGIAAMMIARAVLRDVGLLRSYAETVAAGPEAHLPRLALPGTFQPVAVAIRRLGRAARKAQSERPGGEPALDMLPEPVILLDRDRRLLRANTAARELVGAAAVGRDLAAVLRNPVLLDAVDSVLQGRDATAEAEFAFQVPVERHFSARIARLAGDEPGRPAVVIALYELTAVKRTEQMRTDFIANVSHELRTPISVLLGCVQTLRGSARDDPEAQAEFFGLMEDQAMRMSRLVDDLLSLSRIELNEHTTPTGAAEIAAIVGQVCDALSVKARERNMTIETDIQPGLPTVRGDKDDLVKVFQNLIDNAVKYGAEGSTVRVGARLVQDGGIPPSMAGVKSCLAITVEDHGEGIAPEHIPRLTERFYRVDTARSRQLGGTGLGLAIVKHVLNRHHGALTIDSTPGKGSVFKVFLPTGGAPEPARLPPPAAASASEARA
jgi:two-component system phosphate regulon sensor histidine kinase PhoR